MRHFIFLALAVVMAAPATAATLQSVETKSEFESLVTGRDLTALGVRLQVSPDGNITGRAFGKNVTGSWTWQSGYFCRDLMFGAQALDPNCQAVFASDGRIRFVSDRGTGPAANLRIK